MGLAGGAGDAGLERAIGAAGDRIAVAERGHERALEAGEASPGGAVGGRRRVVGERRFLGLYASTAYTESVLRVPLVAEKVHAVLSRTGVTSDSHTGKDLLGVLENYPRDELFQASVDQLYETALAVTQLQERRRTKLFLREDDFGRFVSCLVYIPRDRYNTTVRLRIEKILREAFHGVSVEDTTRVSDSALARLHYVIRVASGEGVPEVDAAALEQEIVDATRTWDEDFAEAVRVAHGEEVGAKLLSRYGRAFPEAYKEDFAPRVAVAIWRDPWMVVGRDTFTGDLLRRAGLVNAYADHEERYPRVDVADLDAAGLDLVVLPDEPYVFTGSDGPEAFTATRTVLANGRLLTWYGPSMRQARAELDRIAASAART